MEDFARETKTSHFPHMSAFQALMPSPAVYEKEYSYWPWGRLLSSVADWVSDNAPRNAFVVDYMCGTGFLLNEIASRRPDLSVMGCDISQSYVEYGKSVYCNLNVVMAGALTFEPSSPVDIAICTAGLHHLPRNDQPTFLEKLSRELSDEGFVLLGEEVIREYDTEDARKQAVLELFTSLMSHLDQRDAPIEVIDAAVKTFVNDWYERGEYKVSQPECERMLRPFFEVISTRQTWTDGSDHFGDFLFLCRKAHRKIGQFENP